MIGRATDAWATASTSASAIATSVFAAGLEGSAATMG
jgi:hypothetical protein